VDSRLIAIVEVAVSEPRYDASKEWEKQWPLVLEVKPVLRVGRVSKGPPTSILQLDSSLMQQSFVPLTPQQYKTALAALRSASRRLLPSACLRAR